MQIAFAKVDIFFKKKKIWNTLELRANPNMYFNTVLFFTNQSWMSSLVFLRVPTLLFVMIVVHSRKTTEIWKYFDNNVNLCL